MESEGGLFVVHMNLWKIEGGAIPWQHEVIAGDAPFGTHHLHPLSPSSAVEAAVEGSHPVSRIPQHGCIGESACELAREREKRNRFEP